MRKYIALGLWVGADTLEIVRGGLLAAAVRLLGRES
jgi:ABC-type amino acid transport system permease subunit